MNIVEIYNNCKQKSINKDVNKLKINKQKITKNSLIAIITIATSMSFCACSNKNDIAMHNYTLTNILEAQQTLEDNNLMYYDSETGENIGHSIEEYKQIKDLNDDNLLGYYELLGKDETEKIIKALGYSDWDDYLIKNNYTDSSGNPDFDKWEQTTLEINYYGEGKKTK